MPYKRIDSDFFDADFVDGASLPSALLNQLSDNTEHNLNGRLKKGSVQYYGHGYGAQSLVMTGATASLTPYRALFGGIQQTDPNTVGLQFSTPPQGPICTPPILWPLSSRTKKVQLTIAMNALQAPVDVYVFGRIGGRFFGVPPSHAGYLNDLTGRYEWSDEVLTSPAYKQVGTTTLANKLYNPVVLELDVERAPISDKDYAKHRPGDGGEVLELFVCYLSTIGELDFTAKHKAPGSGNDPLGTYGGGIVGIRSSDGSYFDLAQTAGNYHNPGTFHRWLEMPDVNEGLPFAEEDTPGLFRWSHVIQIRPDDASNTKTRGAHFAIWPPLGDYPSGITEQTTMNFYLCGVARVGSVTIEELENV